MGKKTLKENTIFISLKLVQEFFLSLIQSMVLFGKNLFGKSPDVLTKNKFLDVMNFFFQIGPKAFWKAPSGIKIGRSISTFLHYIFEKEQTFQEKRGK